MEEVTGVVPGEHVERPRLAESDRIGMDLGVADPLGVHEVRPLPAPATGAAEVEQRATLVAGHHVQVLSVRHHGRVTPHGPVEPDDRPVVEPVDADHRGGCPVVRHRKEPPDRVAAGQPRLELAAQAEEQVHVVVPRLVRVVDRQRDPGPAPGPAGGQHLPDGPGAVIGAALGEQRQEDRPIGIEATAQRRPLGPDPGGDVPAAERDPEREPVPPGPRRGRLPLGDPGPEPRQRRDLALHELGVKRVAGIRGPGVP